MEAKAQARYVRVTPRKARRVLDAVRGTRVVEAIDVLRFAPQGAAQPVLKTLESAIANARYAADQAGERFNEEDLYITETYADEGPTMKRIQPRAQGRANQILKRTSHITVVVGDTKPVAKRSKGRTR
ncbi:MAG: 50S ribosomal protein L22 [Ancrocorticia sp.]|jgi:large subunit ribosomal protein L22|nr:50S ribosomal protein L22 [Ancrocorticia sp.]MCI1896392.1 50S ribosomal protein L22 [Ancrocorticia sp.]MCI1933111.1 50S ribosomal protein L22 [Ancrocorticia sp.]MCI1963972.1 50S ribosomal protein L22 [Ancrocorticia sp.]MCI2001656.1 50S ribosomal protein L22 [Ancrocorticia sp.]